MPRYESVECMRGSGCLGGSAGESRNGGAGVILARGSVEEPVLVECLEVPAGVIVSSFQAELHAMVAGLEWLHLHMSEWSVGCVASDSQAVLVRLMGSRGDLHEELIVRCAELLHEFCVRVSWYI